MKKAIFLILLSILCTSCSTSRKIRAENLKEQIEKEEIRSLTEIKNHMNLLLLEHPELSEDAKTKVKNIIESGLTRHKELKDEESKTLNFLLEKALASKDVFTQKDKDILKKGLKEIYQKKSENIFNIISEITKMHQDKEVSAEFERDVLIFIRDLR